MTDTVEIHNGLLQARDEQYKRSLTSLDNGPLYAALAKAQAAFKPIVRSKTVRVTSQKGNYTFDYAPLESVLEATRDALSENELALFQLLGHDGAELSLTTTLGHSSGCKVYSRMSIPQMTQGYDKDGNRFDRPKTAQEIGSAVTYMRRYMAQCILGVNAEEDDDGAQGEDMHRETKPKTAPVPPKVEKPKQAVQAAPKTGFGLPTDKDLADQRAASEAMLRADGNGRTFEPTSIADVPEAARAAAEAISGGIPPRSLANATPATKETREKVNALIKKLGMQKMTAEWCQKVLGKPREQVQLESELLVLLADLEARDGATA